jgi:hypothetical protein
MSITFNVFLDYFRKFDIAARAIPSAQSPRSTTTPLSAMSINLSSSIWQIHFKCRDDGAKTRFPLCLQTEC